MLHSVGFNISKAQLKVYTLSNFRLRAIIKSHGFQNIHKLNPTKKPDTGLFSAVYEPYVWTKLARQPWFLIRRLYLDFLLYIDLPARMLLLFWLPNRPVCLSGDRVKNNDRRLLRRPRKTHFRFLASELAPCQKLTKLTFLDLERRRRKIKMPVLTNIFFYEEIFKYIVGVVRVNMMTMIYDAITFQ